MSLFFFFLAVSFIFILVNSLDVLATGRTVLPSISIDAPEMYLDNHITSITIKDVVCLLKKGFPYSSVALNNPEAMVHIYIPEISPGKGSPPDSFAKGRSYRYLQYPDHEYKWVSFRRHDRIFLVLKSPSYQGVSFGLYGLLQEKLGFKFYHPKRTIIPFHERWPLPVSFQWSAIPRFDKKGFHIHSLHPIELSGQLHNPDYPHAAADLREYIDWLVRNQQNMVEFCLLRDLNRARWIRHAGDFVSYAHERGVLAGVKFSLFMVQQKAFQSINILRFSPSYKRQIDSTLSWIFQAGWDFVTVDFSMGEYLPDLGKLMPELKAHLIRQVTGKYNTKLMIPTHVIKSQCEDQGDPGSFNTGILIHSVMFYSFADPSAPVYGNSNLKCLLDRAIHETRRQETWYWPESAYWVSFDNSVPLFLLPYLDARWSDMELMKSIGVDNHLTFGSGWEWGYWLVDWSIARWSWNYGGEGSSPLSVLHDLFPDAGIYKLFQRALSIQNYYLKDRGLIAFMSALDPSAELPWPFNSPFQPRPSFSNSWMLYKASDAQAEHAASSVVSDLEMYASEMNAVVKALEAETERIYSGGNPVSSDMQVIASELTRALEITALRAQHRALTIRALIAQRKGHWWQPATKETEMLLEQAARVRKTALVLVHQQEAVYRYPVNLIARQRKDLTAYNFGYLYPASNLFFWLREEEQVRNRRFDAFYMNIWDFWRILGIKN